MQADNENFAAKMRRFAEFNEQLELAAERAAVDSLTGLASRAIGEAYLGAQLKNRTVLSVIWIDLDCFKQINYRWGHACGDEILRNVARDLSDGTLNFRLLCRWNADKFLVASHSAPAVVEEEAARIRELVCKRYTLISDGSPVEVDVSASVSVATWNGAESLPELIERAETELQRNRNAFATISDSNG